MTDTVVYESDERSVTAPVKTLAELLQAVVQQNYTGLLTVNIPGHASWKLFFNLGRIVWVSGGDHRLRRWYRLLGQDLRGLATTALQALNPQISCAFQIWEYLVLADLIRRHRVGREQAVAIVHQASLEVLFEIQQAHEKSHTIFYYQDPKVTIPDPFKWLNVDSLLAEMQTNWVNWKSAGLANYFSNHAPILYQPEQFQSKVSAKTYEGLCRLLKGQLSLRELAVLLNQSELGLMQSLVGYEQQKLINFIAILDAPVPESLSEFLERSRTLQPSESTNKQHPLAPQQPETGPLVMCIDDNPLICQQMAKIITQGGYRYEAVQDSVQALQSVIELQPSLIFLDLVMSVISGYELCAQIRRIQKFRNTAIVILTSNDGVLDRVRTKMAGATEFVSKPIKPEVIQEMVSKYSPPPHSQKIIFYPD
jgi:two-component system, chemotaxis family, response regulator PixG